MKKFFVMILLVSTFFLGLGALVEKTGASFKSDERALELIRQSRIAIGGDANINNVRSMTVVGNSTHFFDVEGLPQSEQGSVEINMQLPGQFSKMVRIGNPGNGTGTEEIHKQIDVIVTNNDGKNISAVTSGEGKKVVIVKDGDGKVLTENIEPGNGERKIIIKKDDGSVQEIQPGDKGTFVFETKSDDNSAVWNTKDGNKIIVNKDVKIENISGNRQNEMFRMTLALLLTAPEGLDVSYTYSGEGNVDGSVCNIVTAQTGGNSFKLFLDKTTYLPRMISYEGHGMPKIAKFTATDKNAGTKEITVQMKSDSNGEAVEHQLKFSDFRNVGGLLLPHRWAETVGGKQSQNIDITNYEINPANIADKFKGQTVFVRKTKEQ